MGKSLFCVDLSHGFNFYDSSIVLYLGYEVEHNSLYDPKETVFRRIYITGNRSFSIEIVPATEVFVAIANGDNSIYIAEPLIFDNNGVVKISSLLDKHHISWNPASKSDWDEVKFRATRYTNDYLSLYIGEYGFYRYISSYTDFNVFEGRATVYFKKGLRGTSGILHGFEIMGMPFHDCNRWNLDADAIHFLDHVVDDACDYDEYKDFIDKNKEEYVISERIKPIKQ